MRGKRHACSGVESHLSSGVESHVLYVDGVRAPPKILYYVRFACALQPAPLSHYFKVME